MHRGRLIKKLVAVMVAGLVTAGIVVKSHAIIMESKPPEYVANVYNYFGWALFQQMAAAMPAQNIGLSPYSVAEILAVLEKTAGGKTADELGRALYGLDGAPDILALGGFRESLITSSPATLRSASAILVNTDVTINPEFKMNLQQSLNTEIATLPFADPASVQAINSWVAKQTDNKIPTLLGRLPGNSVAVLLNAVYFKADWATPFPIQQTQPGFFTLADGQKRPHPMMRLTAQLAYGLRDRAQMVALPYRGGRFEMLAILPQTGELPDSLLKRLSLDEVLAWRESLAPQRVSLTLPRVSVAVGTAIDQYLPAMGINAAFDPVRAEFPMFTATSPVAVGGIVHKVALDINEQGTEAAAATGVAMVTSIAPDTVFMTIDRPFIYLIRDTQTKQVLFAGVVQNPA